MTKRFMCCSSKVCQRTTESQISVFFSFLSVNSLQINLSKYQKC